MVDFGGMFGSFLTNNFNGTNPLVVDILILFLITLLIVIYSVFVYYFYHFLARKDILTLNLNRFNNYDNQFVVKLFAFVFYILEFIILLPIIIFLWFTVFSIFLFLMSEGLEVRIILLISAALVASVRISSFISEGLSKDLAKLLPFTLLAIAITRNGFFNLNSLMQRFSEIPELFTNIIYFLGFIIVIEMIMRFADLFITRESNAYEED